MSEDKKSLIDLVPDSVDNAVKNITDKPTQNMGTTLADIWYLVFGGISQAAEKRKLKYSYALQEFEKELKEKISKIPEDKLIEPDIQITAQALESAKYCIENEKLRIMFAKLISSTMNIDTFNFSQPIFVDIIKNLKPLDCQILDSIYKKTNVTIHFESISMDDFVIHVLISINKLSYYGLINPENINKLYYLPDDQNILIEYISKNNIKEIKKYLNDVVFNDLHINMQYDKCTATFSLKPFIITPLGIAFKIVCIE